MTLIRKLQKFTDHIKRGTANSFTQKKATKKTALRTPSPYVSRIFKEQIGINYNDYINEKRIEKAKELLCKPELSIKDISDQTGFGSPQHFSRTFRKYTDISPSQYRELHLKK